MISPSPASTLFLAPWRAPRAWATSSRRLCWARGVARATASRTAVRLTGCVESTTSSSDCAVAWSMAVPFLREVGSESAGVVAVVTALGQVAEGSAHEAGHVADQPEDVAGAGAVVGVHQAGCFRLGWGG